MNKYSEYVTYMLTAAVFVLLVSNSYLVVNLLSHDSSQATKKVSTIEDRIEVEWPRAESRVGGVQVFNAYIPQRAPEEYQLYWSVEGGTENLMESASSSFPRKEFVVDTSSWNWKKDGTYAVSFFARYGSELIASSSIIMKTPLSIIPTISNATFEHTQSAQKTIEVLPKKLLMNEASVITAIEPVSEVQENLPSDQSSLSVTWETKGTSDWSDHVFSASVLDKRASEYYLFWQVEDGQYVVIPDDQFDEFLKRGIINFSSWNWLGEEGRGPYRLTFIAQDLTGKEFSRETIFIKREEGGDEDALSEVQVSDPVSSIDMPLINTRDEVQVENEPIERTNFFVSKTQAASLLQSRTWPQITREKLSTLAETPQGMWLGEWTSDIKKTITNVIEEAQSLKRVPIFVVYNIPGRDCGSYSNGGLQTKAEYLSWIGEIKEALGGSEAVIILEPDALAGAGCLTELAQSERYQTLKEAVLELQTSDTRVYIDAGHPYWLTPDIAAKRLIASGIEYASGFSLNVSNFITTEENISYGSKVSEMLGGTHFVIDTSRNGNGQTTDLSWCNPRGRKVGIKTTSKTENSLVDAFMWIKNPGESDGTCNGGPSAGEFWMEYALSLIR